ncbi:leucine-rich repeat-containing protein 1-like [Punica granatum]|uniref:Leucine-rich repeat-containing protein 1-like n=2 Tax=Punica granatum TaxID=22663 RepID=A0A6P8BXU4_PUNGR|nr:leucine-rich repeat-containing protein 1-like [Punica granatum]
MAGLGWRARAELLDGVPVQPEKEKPTRLAEHGNSEGERRRFGGRAVGEADSSCGFGEGAGGFARRNVGSLEILGEVFLKDLNYDFQSLPESIGNFKSMMILEVVDVNIVDLPTVGRLRRLKCLLLLGSWLERLPEAFGDMQSLVELDPSKASITKLRDSFGNLKNLQCLSLRSCRKIEKVPNPFGDLKSLYELDISYSGLVQLPDSIEKLKELKAIKMSGCNIHELPSPIGSMRKLEMLDTPSSLKGEIPSQIGRFSSLRVLVLSRTKICLLPSTIRIYDR